MILIAHRGLLDGPDKNLENKPDIIKNALYKNFEVEVDFWKIDGKYYLGHDEPTYEISEEFLFIKKLWVHCKNIEALQYCNESPYSINYFWHDIDHYTLTSFGYIWVYPGKYITNKSICVMPERVMNLRDINKINCFGICSDFVNIIKNNE